MEGQRRRSGCSTEPWLLDLIARRGPAALVEVQRQKLAMPTDLWVRRAEIWVMRGLGRLDEARALNRAFVEIIPRPILLSPVGGWFFGSTASSLLLEDRPLAPTLLRAEPAVKAKSER
jgi:hypothetical protein